jgi:hypothetical protein
MLRQLLVVPAENTAEHDFRYLVRSKFADLRRSFIASPCHRTAQAHTAAVRNSNDRDGSPTMHGHMWYTSTLGRNENSNDPRLQNLEGNICGISQYIQVSNH